MANTLLSLLTYREENLKPRSTTCLFMPEKKNKKNIFSCLLIFYADDRLAVQDAVVSSPSQFFEWFEAEGQPS